MENNELNTHEYVNDLGKFKPGNLGRPKGAINKNTKDLKEVLIHFLNDKTNELEEIWNQLEPREKIFTLIQLSKIVLPKPGSETTDSNKEPRVFNIDFNETKSYTHEKSNDTIIIDIIKPNV